MCIRDRGIGALTALTDKALTAAGVNEVLHGLVIDGIFQGVGSVLSFLPIDVYKRQAWVLRGAR